MGKRQLKRTKKAYEDDNRSSSYGNFRRNFDRKVRIHGHETNDLGDESLNDFVVRDPAGENYINCSDASSSTGYSNGRDEGDSSNNSEPLYALLKDKISIKGGGKDSCNHDKSARKGIEDELSKLMDDVFAGLDSELRQLTAKKIQNSNQVHENKQTIPNLRVDLDTMETSSPPPSKRTYIEPEKEECNEQMFDDETDYNYGNSFGEDDFDMKLLEKVEQAEKDNCANASMKADFPHTYNCNAYDHNTNSHIIAFYTDVIDIYGKLYLFCKQEIDSNIVTTCVHIRNFTRNVFFLPNVQYMDNDTTSATVSDVQREVHELLKLLNITGYTFEAVTRKYCFSVPNVPKEAEYLMLSYPYTQPELPRNIYGKTFSNVFGHSIPATTLFLLKTKLIGPCWISIDAFSNFHEKVSWCTRYIIVNNYKNINPLGQAASYGNNIPVNSFGVMAVNFLTSVNPQGDLEIISASFKGSTRVKIENITQKLKSGFDYMHSAVFIPKSVPHSTDDLVKFKNRTSRKNHEIKIFSSEAELLDYITNLLIKYDPDVIIGHDITGKSLDTLILSMMRNDTHNWSAIGRLRITRWPNFKNHSNHVGLTYEKRRLIAGRIFCDIKVASENIHNFKSYDLETLASELLNVVITKKNRFTGVINFHNIKSVSDIIASSEDGVDVVYLIAERLSILPLSMQLANIYGNMWSRSIQGANSDGNEHMLLHEFYKKNYILPDKFYSNEEAKHYGGFNGQNLPPSKKIEELHSESRSKPDYTGGLVLEPVRGLHDTCVLLLDFNSLYPSIIMEYNICFTTTNWSNYIKDPEKLNVTDIIQDTGILPELVRTLIERRRQIKSIMSAQNIPETEYKMYDVRQKALKLAANSLYGCLGFKNSRLYAKPLASLITLMGRQALKSTVEVCKNLGLNIIYGDTDSIMILTKTKSYYEAMKLGNNIKRAINVKYKHLEIEVESVISKILLHRKKKYAYKIMKEHKGVVKESGIHVRGLEIVRREWCDLVHDSSRYIIEQILSDLPRKLVIDTIIEHLKTVASDAKNHRIRIEKFVIRKMLSKDPEMYPDKNSHPHVLVALSLKAKGVPVRAKEVIPYVICDLDESQQHVSFSYKARHYDEVAKLGLKPDYKWYFSNQLLPSISRLLDVLDGIEMACIAECLDLDKRKYINHANYHTDNRRNLTDITQDNPAFGKWSIPCNLCMKKSPFEGVVYCKNSLSNNRRVICLGTTCPNPDCNGEFSMHYLSTSLHLFIRECIRKYALLKVECDESVCVPCSNSLSIYGNRCSNASCSGTNKFAISSEQLCNQLIHLRNLVSISNARTLFGGDDDKLNSFISAKRECFEYLESIIQRYLDANSLRFVNFKSIILLINKLEPSRRINITIPYA